MPNRWISETERKAKFSYLKGEKMKQHKITFTFMTDGTMIRMDTKLDKVTPAMIEMAIDKLVTELIEISPIKRVFMNLVRR